jgi:hypothetical protein
MHFKNNMKNNNNYRSYGSQNFEEILFKENQGLNKTYYNEFRKKAK